MKKRLGLFGGTFNPIHNCHIKMAESFFKEMNLNELLIIPSGNSYHKETNVSAEHRYNMCSIAFETFKNISVSKVDIDRKGKTYTFDTLQIIKQLYPDFELWWLLGSDSFLDLTQWHRYQELIELTSFAIVLRTPDNKDVIELFKHKISTSIQYHILKMPYCELSSTAIRDSYKFKPKASTSLPVKVDAYIKDNHLYTHLKGSN